MEAHSPLPYLREGLIFLGAAGLAVPLLSRLKISPVLGYLLAGSIVGPFGLGLLTADHPWLARFVVADIDGVRHLAEIGVVFLMFMIGLELSIERLWAWRSQVFGLGSLQILVCGALVTWIGLSLGLPSDTALVVGMALSLSSTAIVLQLLMDGRRQTTPAGRTGFAILLMQDLAVVPILFMVGVLAEPGDSGLASGLAAALGKAALAIILIYVVGRVVLRPALRQVAAARNAEMFTAAVLLAVVGVAALTAGFGLSMALGALLAGLLLAETEYRHQIEVDIQPFKGLLLGLFFMSVGMGIDWRFVVADPLRIMAAVIALWLLKATVITGLALLFRQRFAVALESGLMLGQSGEFAFVILAAAVSLGLIGGAVEQYVLMLASISMLLTPPVVEAGQRLGRFLQRRATAQASATAQDELADSSGHVVIAGFGRVGQTVAQVAAAAGLDFVAVDSDVGKLAPRLPENAETRGRVFFGDASRADILARAGIARASAVAVTMNDPAAVTRIVREIHHRWPGIPIHARARDEEHAALLRELGASYSTPEAVEASLQLAARMLEDSGFTGETISRFLAEQRTMAEARAGGPVEAAHQRGE
ncbi:MULTISPECIES: monovalent cation:proton antiporter-2 (CPA2) family protein [Novosphingobium]|uniref:monovalent cation:proton antiporter-2 (CPA2) family protein n=1 Tax=Novosphingobium TaxID=165696 RepID=UPI000D6E6F29|nr:MULTISPECIES: monovalent cation:proton antiporter-2 (CPA2) family protein [Novosphingobium]